MGTSSLKIIEAGCIEALDPDDGELSLFRAVADPQSVYAMAQLIWKMHAMMISGADDETWEALIQYVRVQCRMDVEEEWRYRSGGFASMD